MKVSIFIKSWQRDFPWLSFCLRSIQKFVTGYSEIVVALPTGHGLPLTKERIVIADEWQDGVKHGAPSSGYYHQMYVKLCADLHCPDADFILILDSDCVFTRPFDVSEMFMLGKPMLLRRLWSDAGSGIGWKGTAEAALGFAATHDTMAAHPFIYRRDTFADLRAYLEKRFKMTLEQYVRAVPRFIEFVTIGNFILQTCPKQYAIIEAGQNDAYPRPVSQAWSWGGMNAKTRQELESLVS